MKNLWIAFVIGAGLCWGTYVPLIQQGQKELKGAYGAFLCVGLAYFLIAVLLPLGMMFTGQEKPTWTGNGILYAVLAGSAGALGALCVIFAIKSGGNKLYVAPVIFAIAPCVNVIFSLLWHRPEVLPGWKLYAGILLAAAGAGLVLYSKEEAEKASQALHKPKPSAPGLAQHPTSGPQSH
jgi:drug/metabolite transporter (DMT)-like permease